MMKNKSLLITIFLLLMVVLSSSVTFAFFGSDDGEHNMLIATAHDDGHVVLEMGRKFKEIVEEKSEGAITVNITSGGAMGGEEAIIEQVSEGAVEAQLHGSLIIQMFADEHYWIGAPFVIRDYDHFLNIWNSEVGDSIKDIVLEEGNIRFLSVMYQGGRQTTSNIPFKNIEEFQESNLTLRLPQLESWVKIWGEIGANTVPVALNELFSSLQLGVADASEGGLTQIDSMHLNEVQDYLIMTEHLVSTGYLTINEDWFQSLEPELQEIVTEAAEEAGEYATEFTKLKQESLAEDLEEKGMTIIYPEMEGFRKVGEPAAIKLFDTMWSESGLSWEDVQSY
jgi:TRAP-type C4-dicarboxylate transport system substrate-binding protein